MKRKLGLDVVTYTYDWGLVTDLARRNISRICSELQLDHVLVSADIKQKKGVCEEKYKCVVKKAEFGHDPHFYGRR